MKRFHVHVGVDDLQSNIRFYASVFGAPPTMRKSEYAKRMMEDPRVNSAVSQRGAKAGVDHLGIQVDSDEELAALGQQVAAADIATRNQADAACCYARSDKYWITDPQGIAWETYRTLAEAQIFDMDRKKDAAAPGACRTPRPERAAMLVRKAAAKTCC
jgi:catechol 2,3-dioxygenase-like lactoylglutathione lyase family enzyme